MKRVLVVGVALLALGACSSDGSDASPNSQPATTQPAAPVADSAACRLIGESDATSFLGAPATQVQAAATAGESSTCFWTADSAANQGQFLQVRVYDDETHYGITQFKDAKPVSGLGEKAFVSVGPAGADIDVQFVKGGKTFAVNYSVANVVDKENAPSPADRSDELVAIIKANSSKV
jgi:hypothetical protein